jgi:transposase
MTRRGSKPPRLERRVVALEDLERILERTQTGALDDADHATLKAALDTLAFVTRELESTGTSLARLRRMLFGARTETTAEVLGESRDGSDPVRGKRRDAKEKKTRKGHGKNGAAAYPRAARVAVSHGLLVHKAPCPDCQRGKVYEQTDPSVLVRVTGVAPLRATVYELARLRCNLCGTVFTAAPPAGVGSEKYDETAASMIALMKYGCGLPFHRLERLEKNLGIPLPAATQWDVVHRAAGFLEPTYAEFVRQAAQGEVVHNDDTSMRILDLTDEARAEALPTGAREERTGVFTSGIVSLVGGHRIALFATGPQHAGENLADVLAHRDGERAPPIQMSDALTRNTPGDRETIAASCITHARRKYVDVATRFPDECRYVLETLRDVYRNDAQARERGLSAEERLRFHQAESDPLMTDLEHWLKVQLEQRKVEPNSALGEAIGYMQKHWEKLTLFLRVPGAPLDNNVCERALKKAILHRKNALFYKTLNGARVGDVFMSLIHTAELCNVEPFHYLVALLRHAEVVLLDPAAWMPWNYTEPLARLEAPSDALD